MTKKFGKRMIILAIIILIIFILLKVVKVQDFILKQIYPIHYQDYVEEYSKQNEVDKYMIYAIIKAESNFKPDVKSKSKAVGLMQLMEATATEMSSSSITEEDLYEPEINIRLGTKYYAYLLRHYKGNNILALTAYNAGMGNVDTWTKTGVIQADGSDIENIPYKETNNYVRKILRDYRIYLKLYE